MTTIWTPNWTAKRKAESSLFSRISHNLGYLNDLIRYPSKIGIGEQTMKWTHYAPGDGVVRYKLGISDTGFNSYAKDSTVTIVLGFGKAKTWCLAFVQGYRYGQLKAGIPCE